MVKFVDLGVLYFSLVLPRQATWLARGFEWISRTLGGGRSFDYFFVQRPIPAKMGKETAEMAAKAKQVCLAQHGHCTSCLLVERIGLPFVAHGAAVVGRGERQSFSATCCGPCTTHVCVRLCGEGVGRECVWTARLSVCMRPLCTLVLPVAADADETPVLDNRTLRARGRARQQRTAKCISATPRSTRQCRL